MAEGIAFAIAGKIFKMLGSLVVREGTLVWGVKDEIQKLSTTVDTIRLVLLDAEEQHGRKNYAVTDWIKRLKDVFYEADDLLDDFSTYLQWREAMTGNRMAMEVCIFFSKSNQIIYSLTIAHKIKTIREKLDGIKNDRKFHLTKSLDEKNIERETHSFVPAEKVVGRDDDEKNVIQLLLDSGVNENVSVISIFGFGGLGKTALAQLVYNDEHIINYFQLRMWVCVSNNFNVKIIVENIIKSATGKKTEGLDIDQLQERLRKEIINGKKYLLVLDDIWNENPVMWDKLKTLLMDGERGSKILVTTRSKKVAGITSTLESYVYPLKVLDENKSWSLFTQIVFADGIKPKDSKLLEFGKEIVAKCGGVPLVIVTIGLFLYGITEEVDWLHFKDNEMSKVIEEESDILPLLKLSYDHLPSHLKQCFAYCALFPKDYKIKKQKLIYLWMAQGFLQALDKNECLEEVGNKYFTTLLLRSFFQDPQYDEWGNVVACKMHDLMRELAKSVAGTECSFTTIGTIQSVDDKCRHVSLDCGDVKKSWKFPIALYSAKNIRSLLLFYRSNWGFELDGGFEIFSSYRYLRALDFGQLKFKRLLHSNGKLKSLFSEFGHLRYLNFSYMQIEELSNSISRLSNLETLDLSHCDKLKELPRDIRKMRNLRHLINKECDSLCGMPSGLGCLTNLQTLSLFVVSERNSKHKGIEELKGLDNLRGKLKIKNLKYEENGRLANLERKPYLWSLILDWGRSANGEVQKTDEVVLEALKPHPNLKKINISLFTGVKLCYWLSSLTELTSITIKECRRCQLIPPLDQLPHLKSLSLAYLEVVEYISEEASTSYSAFFRSLKELAIDHCPELVGWWRRDADNGAELPSFPCLSKLDVQNCPKLTFMPLYPSLEELKLSETSSKTLEQTMMLMDRVSPTLSNLKSMHMFKIPDLESLSVENMKKLTSMVDLKILSCPRLTEEMEQAIKFLPSLQNLIIKPIEERDPDWINLRGEVIRRIPFYSRYSEDNSSSAEHGLYGWSKSF